MHTTRRLVDGLGVGRPGSLREGFTELYHRLNPKLAVWAALQASSALGAGVQADDLVQETWARVYVGFGSYRRERGDFRGWLFGIASNVLREQLRYSKRRSHGVVGPDPELVDPAPSAATQLARSEVTAQLVAVFGGLDATEQRLVLWRGIEELPYGVCARRLRKSASAVESQWRRLLERLRARVELQDYFSQD